MADTVTELHEWVETSMRAAMTAAMRADPGAIPAAIEELVARRWLDPHSIAFLDRARALVLGSTAALAMVVEDHRPARSADGTEVCRACGITACRTLRRIADILTAYFGRHPAGIDRAEAWRRADAWLNRDSPQRVLVTVEDSKIWDTSLARSPARRRSRSCRVTTCF
jgi:hypothetical protein